ncbi:hypothetical protein DL93DRAFT_2233298 [Clavulina sp. PMI_390]|nr:hypothetical protein DL93DRAFT_2233298 [Clavulina sp. PMI_390]
MLPKGAACFQCRKRKEKCDGLKPSCSRCWWGGTECVYATGIARRRLTNMLEIRAMELEQMIHKMTIISTHELSLASARLLARIRGLGDAAGVKRTFIATHHELAAPNFLPQNALSQHQLTSSDWGEFGTLPLASSLHLISVFLQHREQFYIFIDVPGFISRVSLPPSHLESIQPCLLNACYLGACSKAGGELKLLEPYFLRRTRHFLDQALMFVDRITDFLRASLILGCYLARKQRMKECFSILGAATQLASACGLSKANGTSDSDPAQYLLPQAKDAAEAVDRIRLAHSFYLMDHMSPVLGGPASSFPYDGRWVMTVKDASINYQYSEGTALDEKHLSELWRSHGHLKVALARTLDQVMSFARSCHERGSNGSDHEYTMLAAQISSQCTALPPLCDAQGHRSQEDEGAFKPDMLPAYMAMHGNGLLLHTVYASKDPEARRQMLKCIDAIFGLCETIQRHGLLRGVQSCLLIAMHMMNATRVVAHELQRSEAKANARLSTNYCNLIDLFLDIIDDITLLSPTLADSPLLLKDSLTAAVNSLITTY